ncbi:MAG: FISUMP domain-containing protein [Deltaproteobacteria bacterium]
MTTDMIWRLRNAIRSLAVFALTIAAAGGCGALGCSVERAAKGQKSSAVTSVSRQMADGNEWTTQNLSIDMDGSYCYADSNLNCRRYGRLYTWEAAQRACASLGDRWRLPAEGEWRVLAARYGGVAEASQDRGKAAYRALMSGGSSGFNALLGGDRANGQFARLEEHGFYWTASQTGAASAVFYNFGKGGLSLSRHNEGDKQMAISVRCIKR